jgi:hypothetical protein
MDESSHFESWQREEATRLQEYFIQEAEELKNNADVENHGLPLARIKKIMKSDEDVKVS